MKVLVTGSSGTIGRYVVSDLMAAGYDVLGIDVNPPAEKQGRFLRVDLTQPGEVYEALAGSDAVVHMGAWANAGIVPDTRTYGENTQGTFNVFRACTDLGIKRIVSASSAQVYGFAAAPPVYLPVDEKHPLRPVNSYALSKAAGEQAADYFVKNFGLTILSFRIMGTRVPTTIPNEIEQIRQDPAGGSWLLWTRTDARDMARACRLAIEKDEVPAGPYNVTGGFVLKEPMADVIQRHFGDQTEIRNDLTKLLSPLSCERAYAAFGYRPQHLWQD